MRCGIINWFAIVFCGYFLRAGVIHDVTVNRRSDRGIFVSRMLDIFEVDKLPTHAVI